jgi:hypothetical protein
MRSAFLRDALPFFQTIPGNRIGGVSRRDDPDARMIEPSP